MPRLSGPGRVVSVFRPSPLRIELERAHDLLGEGAVLVDLSNRDFRVYSTGVLLSLVGNWVEAAAFGYVVLLLGGSAATLGLIGFLNTIPNLVFALPGGALADRFDRRKLLFVFQGLNM